MGHDERVIKELLDYANVQMPTDIEVHHPKFYARVLKDGPLGLGESYMEGWWDSKKSRCFFC